MRSCDPTRFSCAVSLRAPACLAAFPPSRSPAPAPAPLQLPLPPSARLPNRVTSAALPTPTASHRRRPHPPDAHRPPPSPAPPPSSTWTPQHPLPLYSSPHAVAAIIVEPHGCPRSKERYQ